MQIVTDSASDLQKNYIDDSNIKFKVVPLYITIGGNEYKDDSEINVENMLLDMDGYQGKSTTSCPTPDSYFNAFMDDDITFCVTISSKMSGSYNSAVLAAKMASENGKKVYVVDSKAVAGSQVLIVDKLVELINAGKSFEEISIEIEEYNGKRNLLFMLDKFDNLIKNGRMGKLAGTIASMFSIKPIMSASKEGEISLVEKIIGAKKAIKKLIENIENRINPIDKTIVIAHCQAESLANSICSILLEKYNGIKVKIINMRGLTSFYAEKGGIIISF